MAMAPCDIGDYATYTNRLSLLLHCLGGSEGPVYLFFGICEDRKKQRLLHDPAAGFRHGLPDLIGSGPNHAHEDITI